MSEKKQKKNYTFLLFVIAAGIWVQIMQNAGVIPSNQKVYVDGGNVDVSGSVRVNGSVDVDNTVDVNISKINGKRSFYNHNGDDNYNRIPVYIGN